LFVLLLLRSGVLKTLQTNWFN